MNIAIVGPGAIGCLFAALLARSGQNVCLLDHDRQRAEFLSENPIRVEGVSGNYQVLVPVFATPSAVSDADVIMVCVKGYHTREAVEKLLKHMKLGCKIVTVQNGVGNIETLSEIFGQNRVWGGITAQGATYLGLGNVRHAGQGQTVISTAVQTGDLGQLQDFIHVLDHAGISSEIAPEVLPLVWSKLMVNVGINALTAITSLKNGQLLEYSGTMSMMEQAVAEAELVAKAQKIELLYERPFDQVKTVAKATAGNVSSMLQDILAKRRTEIDSINGAIISRGRELNIDVPVNNTLTNLVRTIESSYGMTV